jgi:hypothetical protein
MKRFLLAFALMLLFLGGCSEEKMSERCQPASEKQIERIRLAIQDDTPGNNITNLYAVKSSDFEKVFMVGGNITGDGIKPGEAIGVWAFGGDLDNPSGIFSVNHMAQEFSVYGLGSTTTYLITMSSDGAEEVKECVRISVK